MSVNNGYNANLQGKRFLDIMQKHFLHVQVLMVSDGFRTAFFSSILHCKWQAQFEKFCYWHTLDRSDSSLLYLLIKCRDYSCQGKMFKLLNSHTCTSVHSSHCAFFLLLLCSMFDIRHHWHYSQTFSFCHFATYLSILEL